MFEFVHFINNVPENPKLINEYGVSLAETARRLGISTSGVAQILRRSEGV
jgi:DNA-directed RNA polymerase specialized sigma subunit